MEGDAALQVADVLRGLQVLAVQKHAQLHRVAEAARLRVDALEDDCEVRPIVNAGVKLAIFEKILGFHADGELATHVLAVGVDDSDVALRGSDRFDVDAIAVRVGLAIGSTSALGVTVRDKSVLSALYVLWEEKPNGYLG